MKKVAVLFGVAALAVAGGAIAQNAAPAESGHSRMMAKSMTRAEADAHAREMFARLDVNKDGRIDKSDREQDRAAKQLEHFRMLDKDGNGSISQSEFLAAGAEHEKDMGHGKMGSGMAMGDGGSAAPTGGDMMGGRMGKRGDDRGGMMGKMMVGMADADKDGVVTQAEFLAAEARHFDMVDTDKDGTITPEERRAVMAKTRDHMKQMRGGNAPAGAGHDHPAG